MLPMKWMSIESIADGTFTEKSDVYVLHNLHCVGFWEHTFVLTILTDSRFYVPALIKTNEFRNWTGQTSEKIV